MNYAASPPDAENHRYASPLKNPVRLVRSFVAVVSTSLEDLPLAEFRLQSLPSWNPIHLISADRTIELMFADAELPPEDKRLLEGRRLNLLVGDVAEWGETQGHSCMANAASVEWEPRQSSLRILSSIVGLPPIFIYRESGTVAVASELHLLRAVANLRLAVNPQAAMELFTIGYPLEHRTLFRDVTVMPGGHILQVDSGAKADFIPSWEPPEPRPEANWSLFLDLQAEAFKQA